MALWRYLKFPRPPSLNESAKHYGLMTCYGCWTGGFAALSEQNATRVVVGCNNQAKKKDDPSVRFHCFPEKPELYRAWVNALKRTTLPKDPRVCSKHFERSSGSNW